MTKVIDLSALFRVAVISLFTTLTFVGFLVTSTVAHAGPDKDMAKEPALDRRMSTGWLDMTNTASAASTDRAGRRGTVALCGSLLTNARSIACTETATAVQTGEYMGKLQIMLNDGNADDTLAWDNVDIALSCDDVFGDAVSYRFTNIDLNETPVVLGDSSALEIGGNPVFCGKIRGVTFSNDDTGADFTAADYITLDSSDGIKLALTDYIVPPLAPVRSTTQGGLERNIESVCFQKYDDDVTGVIRPYCTKANRCTTTLISGGRKGVGIDISSCFSGASDVTDATAAFIEGGQTRINGKSGLY